MTHLRIVPPDSSSSEGAGILDDWSTFTARAELYFGYGTLAAIGRGGTARV